MKRGISMTMKSMCFLGCLVLALGMAAPALAGELNDSEEPGSVLVFYEFRSGTILTPDQGIVPRTRFSISATCPPHDDPTTCAELGQNVRLEAHWVCPGDGFSICNEVDFNLGLTVNGTIVFDATGLSSNGLRGLVPVPGCDRGYLIAWVGNGSGPAIKVGGVDGKDGGP